MNRFRPAAFRPRPALAGAALVAAVVAAYVNSLHGTFVWDDVPTIVHGTWYRHLATVFTEPAAVNTASGRPLVSLSLALNYALGGLNPLGYHIFNVLVHVAAALTLFGFVRRLALLPRWGGRFAPHATALALGVAAVWALQPLQTQAVAYVIQRAESMMGLCYLLTLYCFIRGAESAVGCRAGSPDPAASIGRVTIRRDREIPPYTAVDRPASGGKGPVVRGSIVRARSRRALENGRSEPAPLPSAAGSQGVSAERETEDRKGPVVWYALSVLACALGMAAKEVMVSAPVVVLLFDRTFLTGSFRRALASKKWFYGALFCTWLILAWLVVSLGGNRDGSTGGLSVHARWLAYWLTQFPAVATYLKLAFFPHPLIFQYGKFWLPDAAAALPGALVVVPVVALAVVALFRWPTVGFFGFWFFSILAVTSLVPGTVDMIVDYRMYVALAPLWILVAAGLYQWRPRLAAPVLGAVAVAFGTITVARNRVYRSALSLWTVNVAQRPDNPLARYNLAVALMGMPGRAAEAQAQLEAAVKLAPDFASAHYNLALLLAREPGQTDRAIAQYEQVIRIAPRDAQAHNNLAVLLYDRGHLRQACRQLQLAVQYDPTNLPAWLNLVNLLGRLHRPNDALAACAALVRAHPDFAVGQATLGMLLVSQHRETEAIPHLEKALRLNPGEAVAQFYLGTLLAQRGEHLPEAVALLEKAVRQRPDSAIAQFNLASTLEKEGGHRAEAIAHYRAAATLGPDVPAYHFRFARLLATDPRTRAEARSEVVRTLALDPDFPGAQALLDKLESAVK